MKKSLKFCKSKKGFTLVELVIVIAIVIILSVISVPIYRGYVDKAKLSEVYAFLGTIISAEKAYYSEYGNFIATSNGGPQSLWNAVLGIDARGSKYFSSFHINILNNDLKKGFYAGVYLSQELKDKFSPANRLEVNYNITEGSDYYLYNSNVGKVYM